MKSRSWLAAALLLVASGTLLAEPPGNLPIEQIRKGVSFTIRSPAQFVVARTPEQWAAAWRLLRTDSEGNVTQPGWLERYPLPSVDLTRSVVLGIVLETHSNGCTGVTITSAAIKGSQVLVRYRERKMRTDVVEACPASLMTAFDFVAVSASELPVVFKEE